MRSILIFGLRFLVGRPLDGRPRTDATWFRPGTTGTGHSGRASSWHLRPGWFRSGVRMGCLVVAAGLAWLLVVAVWVVLLPLLVVAVFLLASGTGYAGFHGFRWAVTYRHRRQVVAPLHARLTSSLNLPYKGPDEYLTVPRDYRKDQTDGVRIGLPEGRHFLAEEERLVRDIVTKALGMRDADVQWERSGNRPHVVFFPAARPPVKLEWSDVEKYIREASPTAPFVGIAKNGKPIYADLEADSPHWLIAAGSGGGKSILTRLLAAQGLSRGANCEIFDYKRQSHRWAQGLPGVTYHKTIAEMHDALVRLGAEGDFRNVAADDGQPIGPRTFLIMEEMNATKVQLDLYWETIREKDDPKKSPAVTAWNSVLFMGRQVEMHGIAIAQSGTARTLGGPEARENFALRCLARYTLNSWKMLAPEVWPAPKRSRIPGRWQIVVAGDAIEVQVPMVTDERARDLVLGAACARTAGVPSPRAVPDLVSSPGTVSDETGAPEELVSLREAQTAGVVGSLTLSALRRASTREGFPTASRVTPTASLYRRGELATWYRRREGVQMVKASKGGVA